MLQITPQMKILVAVEPADFRRGMKKSEKKGPAYLSPFSLRPFRLKSITPTHLGLSSTAKTVLD